MDASSPLAAMRPAPASPFNQGSVFGKHLRANRLTGTYKFQRNNSDLFKSVRGSSPAASLAADLSQNFKLNDASSPMFPTPRRSLFTTATMIDASEGRDYATTPPLPESPALDDSDMMDMSPLPQKASRLAHVELSSPTPGADEMLLESPTPHTHSLDTVKSGAVDRRKLCLKRPSLLRTKGLTSNGLTSRAHGDVQAPPSFRLSTGDDSNISTSSSPMSLSECFEDSPPQEHCSLNIESPTTMATTRARAHLSALHSVRDGSPITARRSANTFARTRRQYRRSLSMFENPEDIIKGKKDGPTAAPSTLQSIMDMEEPHQLILPHFFTDDPTDTIPRITRQTLLDVLDGKYSQHYDHKMVIDCRFEYEYEGGHIDGAVNYNDKELLADHLFRHPMEGRTLLIFHCEYSAHRAPIMARYIRSEDRNYNADNYPKLTYPEIYILDGGYSSFFCEHRERCYPQAYVEMNDAKHVNTCEREMSRLRQQRKGLSRAQTYAFGQRGQSLDESPTALGRGHRDREFSKLLAASPLGSDRAGTRRVASF